MLSKSLPTHKSKRSGFTLIELLTVIAIVAVLGAIIVPIIGGAREKSDAVKSLTNLRSMGQGLNIVIVDGAPGGLPPGYYPFYGGIWDEGWGSYGWPDLIGEKLGFVENRDNKSVWSVDRKASIFFNPLVDHEGPFEAGSHHYGYNLQHLCGTHWRHSNNRSAGIFKTDQRKEKIAVRVDEIVYPSRMVVIAECSVDGANDHAIASWAPPSSAYNGGGHYLFADGHVEWMDFNHVMDNFDYYFKPQSGKLKTNG
ncbi:type II secretion system protein [Rubellicoccus peritrichatus]|uniref:Type II secretion system protein n=1 Tax=Rubellicoccus peritrichatus TaxID=3080537 RepID=A0AAQ3LAC1_9BACT|nr:type II secretion system protein [Puniceicoccus sp. CR14]WOO40869.1 type II secretion system protein [Puniceicoccus sp. CR14]